MQKKNFNYKKIVFLRNRKHANERQQYDFHRNFPTDYSMPRNFKSQIYDSIRKFSIYIIYIGLKNIFGDFINIWLWTLRKKNTIFE